MTGPFHLLATIMKMMVVLVLLGFFCLGTPATATRQTGILEFSSREDLETWGGYGEEKLSRVIISGKILCHASRHDKAPYHSYSVSGLYFFNVKTQTVLTTIRIFIIQNGVCVRLNPTNKYP